MSLSELKSIIDCSCPTFTCSLICLSFIYTEFPKSARYFCIEVIYGGEGAFWCEYFIGRSIDC